MTGSACACADGLMDACVQGLQFPEEVPRDFGKAARQAGYRECVRLETCTMRVSTPRELHYACLDTQRAALWLFGHSLLACLAPRVCVFGDPL